jgi:hypothetical protein
MIVVLYPDKRDADLRPRLAVTMNVLAGWLGRAAFASRAGQ